LKSPLQKVATRISTPATKSSSKLKPAKPAKKKKKKKLKYDSFAYEVRLFDPTALIALTGLV